MSRRITALEVLAENLRLYMVRKGIESEAELAKLSKVSQKSINNILNRRHDPYLSTVNKLSSALGIEPYHLLCPAEDDKFLAVCQAWAQSDERGRDDLQTIAEAMIKKRDSRETEERGFPPAANSGRA